MHECREGILSLIFLGSKILQKMRIYITEEIVEQIARSTNIYLAKIRNNYSRKRDYYDTETIEVDAPLRGRNRRKIYDSLRGRCKLKQYIANKSAKYAVMFNMEVYTGKQQAVSAVAKRKAYPL